MQFVKFATKLGKKKKFARVVKNSFVLQIIKKYFIFILLRSVIVNYMAKEENR